MADKMSEFLPYQFDMPVEMKRLGTEKARTYGINLATLFRIHWQQFIDRPIEDSLKMIADSYKTVKKNSRRTK